MKLAFYITKKVLRVGGLIPLSFSTCVPCYVCVMVRTADVLTHTWGCTFSTNQSLAPFEVKLTCTLYY